MVEVHVVSHTHWDREWYLTREQFRLRLVDLVDRVLERLEAEPGFLFHLDGQTVVLEDYLEVRPEASARLRRHVASGRLLVGPWYVMPDQFLVSGEALVRNLALGHRIARGLGGVMAAGYIPDPFGHVAQMPQLLRGFGLDSAVLWRGLGAGPAERWWEAPDGSRVLLLHLPTEGYCNALRLPLLPRERMAGAAEEVVRREAGRSGCGQVLLMAGVDHAEPHAGLAALVAALGEVSGVRARLSTLPDFVRAVREAVGAGAALPRVRGELRAGQEHAFLLPGVLSARTYLKRANARVQRELEHWAEPLSTFAWLCGAEYPQGVLDYAWRTLLHNHPHDSICGCSVDAVHEENVTRFARAFQAAEGLAERAARVLAGQVEAPPAGVVRGLLLHTGAQPYDGVIEAAVELPVHAPPAATGCEVPYVAVPPADALCAVRGPEGDALAFQVLSEEPATVYAMSRFEPPRALPARRLRLLLAAEVAGCGYCTVDLHFGGAEDRARVADPVRTGTRWLENALVRVEAADDGTLDVIDLRSGRRYRRCLELEDDGDVGDEYTFAPPVRDRRTGSREARVKAVSVVEGGPLRGSLRLELELPVPEQATPDRASRAAETVWLPVTLEAALCAGSARVDVGLTVDNRARDHRLRVTLPTGAASVATARADSAFALVERAAAPPPMPPGAKESPVGTAPLTTLVDAGDEVAGISVFADGLTEYEVLGGHEPRLALTLLRCVGFLSRDDLATRQGHAGPGLPTPGAQCPGRHEFRFAFAPRAAPPDGAALFSQARAFLSPPRLIAHAGGTGRLGRRGRLLQLDGEAVLSACTRASERPAVLLRAFNPGPAAVRLRAGVDGVQAAHALDLLEGRQRELALDGQGTVVDLGPHAIATVELEVQPQPVRAAAAVSA